MKIDETPAALHLGRIRLLRNRAAYYREMHDFYLEQVEKLSPYRRDGTFKKELQRMAVESEKQAEAIEAQAGELIREIEAVPDQRERQLLFLRFVDGMSWTDASRSMGLSSGWFYTLRKRALEKFEQFLSENADNKGGGHCDGA